MAGLLACLGPLTAMAGILYLTAAGAWAGGDSRRGEDETAPALVELSWMVGYWVGEEEGVRMEELWLPPAGGLMLGLHRDEFEGGRFFEYLRIEETADGVVYVASPRGRGGTTFRLLEVSAGRAVFANPEHDFPQRILYWLEHDGRLRARIEGEEDGVVRSREWVWSRLQLPGSPPPSAPPAERTE